MKPFDYLEPTTVEEAVAALARPGTRALAGGTDLLVQLRLGALRVERVVNLKRIAALRGIRRTDAGIELGALVAMADLVRSRVVPLLAEAALQMASPQVRHLATVAGNLCNASPAADLAPPLLVLGAAVRIAGTCGERELALEEFFLGPGRTCLHPGEIVTRLVIPPDGRPGTFLKLTARQALDLAIVNVAAARGPEGVRVALGAVAPTPIRAWGAEEALRRGATPAEAGAKAAEECSPIDDLRSSAWYRREMVTVLVRRALEAIA